jgi:hypothetical protein
MVTTGLIILLIIILFLFIIFRNLVCWYFKINERIELQTETNNLLRQLVKKNDNSNNSELTKEKAPFYGDSDELKKAIQELKS